MANKHLYFFMENTGLNETQRTTLVDWFKTFGRADNSPFPNLRMHTRVRLDNEAVIFESVLNEDWLTVEFLTNKLADVFSVDPGTITVDTSSNIYGTLADFQRPAGTSRMRIGVFGGINATWEESRLATVAYLSAFSEQWETAE